MNAPRALAAAGLLLLATGCAGTPEARRDEALQAAIDSGRAACIYILSDPSIEKEPGLDDYCRRVVNGCSDVKP